MGTVVYCVMISLGEMIAYLPIPGGHIALAERFVDPGWAFAMVRIFDIPYEFLVDVWPT